MPVLVPDRVPSEPPKRKYVAVRLQIEDERILSRTVFDPESLGAAELDLKREVGRILLGLRNGG